MKDKINCMKGFTLIELLVVVLIIGILAAVALPQYQMAVSKTRYATLKNVVHALAKAEEVYYMENGNYTEDLTELVLGAAGCRPTDNPRQCLYSWGRCQVKFSSGSSEYCASCNSNQIHMQYRVYFEHSVALPGKRMCLALNRDLSSVQNKICKSETKATTPGTGTTNAYTWVYQ